MGAAVGSCCQEERPCCRPGENLGSLVVAEDPPNPGSPILLEIPQVSVAPGALEEKVDIPTKGLPEAPAMPSLRRWKVSIAKEDGKPLGLGVKSVMPHDVVVTTYVKAGGVVDAFNVAHPAEAVATGDQIVTVNGEAASAEELVAMIRKSPTLTLELERGAWAAPTWAVTLAAGPGALGFTADHSARGNTAIGVAGLKEAGLLAEFNAANPGVAVQSGDIIVGVNGVVGSADAMVEELRKSDAERKLVVERPIGAAPA